MCYDINDLVSHGERKTVGVGVEYNRALSFMIYCWLDASSTVG